MSFCAYPPGGYFLVKSNCGGEGGGSHCHNWVDYNGVAFLVELLEWGRNFRDFSDKKF